VIGGVVLAAGAGTRFGGGKQLAELGGRPLVEWALRVQAQSPVERTVVVLGCGAESVAESVNLYGAEPVICDRWREGQSASLACGLSALGSVEAAVITLGDQPHLAPEAIARVLAARGEGVDAVRATYGGEPGHPVLLERELFDRLRDVTGDLGARNVLLSANTVDVPCDDLGGGEDVDTPAELDALRHSRRTAAS
jgi:CTP:molybdopterin cytidylyltransferase MocA